MVTRAAAQASAAVVRDEVIANANTATRVGQVIRDIADSALWPGEASIVNADVAVGAAIAGSKIAPDFGAQNVVTTGSLLLGATPRASTAGIIQTGYNFTAYTRNNGNTADMRAFKFGLNDSADTHDCVMIGDGTAVSRIYIQSSNGCQINFFSSVVGGLLLKAPGGFGSQLALNNKAILATMEEFTFDYTRPYNTIFRRDNDPSATPSFDQIFRGPGASGGTNQNGRHALVQGGRKTGTGLAGSVKLQRNPDDATFTTVFEIGDVGGASAMGAFGKAPVVKPSITGALSAVLDTNAQAVLQSIIDALKDTSAGLGFVTNSTT